MATTTISQSRMRINAEVSINEHFDNADKHAQMWNNTALRGNNLVTTRRQLEEQLGKPLTPINLAVSWILVVAIFASFVLMEAIINRDSLSAIFGNYATSGWEEFLSVIAGGCIALVNMAAGHMFAKTVMNAEENPVTGKKTYDKKGILIPIGWILTYIAFQQFLVKSASGGYGEVGNIQLMSAFLAVLEFSSAFLIANRVTAIMLGFTNWQIRRVNNRLMNERSVVSKEYAEYTFQREKYNEVYSPNNPLSKRHSNFIDLCLDLVPQAQPESQPSVEHVGDDEIENAVDSILGDGDTVNDESSTDYQL